MTAILSVIFSDRKYSHRFASAFPKELTITQSRSGTRFHFRPAFTSLVAVHAFVRIGRMKWFPTCLQHFYADAGIVLTFFEPRQSGLHRYDR